ncbi:MAG: DUF1622 domain-containing protein [Alphaproteobacteria bacterium]
MTYGLAWIFEPVIAAMELTGVAVMVAGIAFTGFRSGRLAFAGDPTAAYHDARAGIGRSILLGLEILVAADIIATVAMQPELEKVLFLAGIVLIRIVLSLSLEVEIEGRWPWRRGQRSDA